MKIVRNHLWLSLAAFLILADAFLSNVPALFPVHHQRLKILHKIQLVSSEDTNAIDVDLFERADDSDRLVPMVPPSEEGSLPFVTLLVLSYVLVALYSSKTLIPHHKISFHSFWQKTTTSL